MNRKLNAGDRLVVASHNPGKVREIGDLVRPYGLVVTSAAETGLPEPEETGSTFARNAAIKAMVAASTTGLPALSDDSGLEVHDLDNQPGLYSARWAGPEKDFSAAMKRINDELGSQGRFGPDERGANFTCVLCIAWPDGECVTFEGKVFGQIVWPMRGEKGFGYDPIFIPDGHDLTFGEMEPAAKHAMSHRARAFSQFVAACLDGQA